MRLCLGILVGSILAIASACRDTGRLHAIDLEAVYERTDRDFESAVLFRPDDSTADDPAHLLAPLIVVESGVAGSVPPEVSYERTEQGWAYRWIDPVSGIEQGIHATLDAGGFPLVYEVLRDSSGARLMFVDMSLEQRAVEEFGSPLPGRRFSVERSLADTPDVAVGGTYEPGATPLGPFVYLWNETHDVNVVLCRCMAPRVFDIVDSIAYTLKPYESRGRPALAPDAALRLPGGR